MAEILSVILLLGVFSLVGGVIAEKRAFLFGIYIARLCNITAFKHSHCFVYNARLRGNEG